MHKLDFSPHGSLRLGAFVQCTTSTAVPGDSEHWHLHRGLIVYLVALLSGKQNGVQAHIAMRSFQDVTYKLVFPFYLLLLFRRDTYSIQMGILVTTNLHMIMLLPVMCCSCNA